MYVSKVFEIIMCQQVEDFILTGLKSHNTQHCLMRMLERWKKTFDKGGDICAIFMDLSRVFKTLNNNFRPNHTCQTRV